jgi:hypothetical protein
LELLLEIAIVVPFFRDPKLRLFERVLFPAVSRVCPQHRFQTLLASLGAPPQSTRRRVAGAQIDLHRVRHARHQLLSQALSDPDYESEGMLRKKAALAIRFLRRFDSSKPMPDNVMEFLYSKPEGPYKFAAILADKTRQLLALDRYERRAVSRRNRAIQSLDAVRVLAALSVESADANLATGRS